MKKMIAILLILFLGLVMISGCDTNIGDSGNMPQPPGLPKDNENNQQNAESDKLPEPPALPEEWKWKK